MMYKIYEDEFDTVIAEAVAILEKLPLAEKVSALIGWIGRLDGGPWDRWADNWNTGADRSVASARTTENVAYWLFCRKGTSVFKYRSSAAWLTAQMANGSGGWPTSVIIDIVAALQWAGKSGDEARKLLTVGNVVRYYD
jgi:hypothetical protein